MVRQYLMLLHEAKGDFGFIPGSIQRISGLASGQSRTTTSDFWMTNTALPIKIKPFVGLAAAAMQSHRY